MVEQVDLVLFDCLCDSILEDFGGCGILQREHSFDHLIRVLELSFSEVIFVSG